jgi:hypothetical protein
VKVLSRRGCKLLSRRGYSLGLQSEADRWRRLNLKAVLQIKTNWKNFDVFALITSDLS